MKKLLLNIALCTGILQTHHTFATVWEYKTIKIPAEVSGGPAHGYIYTLNLETFDTRLNTFAGDGWELVALAPIATGQHGTNYVVATFKRPRGQ